MSGCCTIQFVEVSMAWSSCALNSAREVWMERVIVVDHRESHQRYEDDECDDGPCEQP